MLRKQNKNCENKIKISLYVSFWIVDCETKECACLTHCIINLTRLCIKLNCCAAFKPISDILLSIICEQRQRLIYLCFQFKLCMTNVI